MKGDRNQTHAEFVGSHKVRVKLSKLEINKFGGDPKEYTSFKDAFNMAVNQVESISEVEKFTY